MATVAILLDGVIYASWLFIVAAGMTLVYGVMKILNLAHGSFYAIGAYTAASAIGWYFGQGYVPALSYLVLIAAAVVAGSLTALLVERGVLRLVYGRSDEILMVLVTYAVLLILEDATKLIWGVDAYYAFQPYALLGRTRFEGLRFANYDLIMIGVAALVGLALWWGLNRTRQGRLLRAIIHDREISIAMGIDVTRMFIITFVLGGILGALAGALTAPALSVVPGMGIEVIVIAFAVVVTGGLGSVPGALVGALIIGLARATAVHLLPEVELFVVYGVMAAVLAVRPQGLFGQAAARKI